MTDPLALLSDLEKNPGARKYSASGYGIEEFRDWLSLCEVPVDECPWVHIAGTKGKGSTAAIVEALLRTAGLRTGLYTSPHIEHFGERYRIDGQAWSPDRFSEAVGRLACRITAERTVFEVLTAIAFHEFHDSGVTAGILETGLGGRLDCTNVIRHPVVTVITSIGLDHTAILGSGIEAIAAEKAGIVKAGCPLVLFDAEDEPSCRAREVILDVAAREGAPVFAPSDVRLVEGRDPGQVVEVEWFGSKQRVCFPLHGTFQRGNLGLALRAAELFLEDGGSETCSCGEVPGRAMEAIHWPGRMEVLPTDPPVILDAAHCPLSARALGGALHEASWGDYLPLTLVWGMQKDKDHAAFLDELLDAAPCGAISEVITYTVAGSRGAAAAILDAVAARLAASGRIQKHQTAGDAANGVAMAMAGGPAGVLACGTVYSLGEIRSEALRRGSRD